MPFNRINGYYFGELFSHEHVMTIEDQNDELNQILQSHLNDLNAKIDGHEKQLKKMMIPRDVEYTYHKEDVLDGEGRCLGETYYHVGLIKLQGSWRLCHGIEDTCVPYDTNWKPLVDSSIGDRLRAVPHLETLRSKVVEEKKKLIPELEAAIDILSKSLGTDGNARDSRKR